MGARGLLKKTPFFFYCINCPCRRTSLEDAPTNTVKVPLTGAHACTPASHTCRSRGSSTSATGALSPASRRTAAKSRSSFGGSPAAGGSVFLVGV